jgi:uncharacterized protein (DUF2235 family)
MMRRLVVLADGTWNEPAQKLAGVPAATNIVALARAVLPRDARGVVQVVGYHDGVGARDSVLDRLTGGAFGVGLSRIIQDLYLFLACNYAPGDEVWLFGFSRGAYLVRSLAGLIRNSGLLRREHLVRYADAYALYRDRTESTHPRSSRAQEFRHLLSWPEFNIRFIGVWDTVGALGIPISRLELWNKRFYEFHDTQLSSRVELAYQALAIDERRPAFEATLWKKQPTSPAAQVLQQAWFPGDHSDVGGGHGDRALADGALAWMWERAEHAGLALDPGRLPAGDAAGLLHGMDWRFWLLGSKTREIGTTNPVGNELISAFALDRMDRVKEYEPVNVAAFRGREPDAIDPELRVPDVRRARRGAGPNRSGRAARKRRASTART